MRENIFWAVSAPFYFGCEKISNFVTLWLRDKKCEIFLFLAVTIQARVFLDWLLSHAGN
jgi:hypothetical protein